MNIISHRGNINGPVTNKENRPSYIDSAIQLGYDVEVDLRIKNGEFWLGHDEPQYKIDIKWMSLRKNKLWFHCKDIESALELSKHKDFKYFCHSKDEYVLVSSGHLWVHNLKGFINNNCIIPLLNENDIIGYNSFIPYGVCTDFVGLCKFNLKLKGVD